MHYFLSLPRRLRRWLFLPLGIATTALAGAQVTAGTIDTGDLVGDPTSPFSTTFPYPASPYGNPYWEPNHPQWSETELRIQLGKALFWDEQLSSDNTMACGTCHAMNAGGTDIRPASLALNLKRGSSGMFPQDIDGSYRDDATALPPSGVNDLKRVTGFNAPTMINSAYFKRLFWRHRAGPSFNDQNIGGSPLPGFANFAAPESLAAFPPVSDIEMGHDGIAWASGAIQNKLADSRALRFATASTVPPDINWLYGMPYVDAFDVVFGPPPGGAPHTVTRERVAMAIGHYIRSLISDKAPINYPPGSPSGLSDEQIHAFKIMDENRCFECHSSSRAPELHPNGGFVDKFDSLLSGGFLASVDLPPPGHQVIDEVTGLPVPADVKVPSLLNMGLRNNFFHSGQISGLANLVDFYNNDLPTAPRFTFNPPLSNAEKGMMLDLWQNGLTDKRVALELFPFDRPDLYSERITAMGSGPIGSFPASGKENHYGLGTAGAAGVPFFFANNPLAPGDPWFKTGVGRGAPGAPAKFFMSAAQGPGFPWLIDTGSSWSSSWHFLDANGYTTWRITDPGPPALFGLTWYGQWAMKDNLTGIAATDGAAFVLQ